MLQSLIPTPQFKMKCFKCVYVHKSNLNYDDFLKLTKLKFRVRTTSNNRQLYTIHQCILNKLKLYM